MIRKSWKYTLILCLVLFLTQCDNAEGYSSSSPGYIVVINDHSSDWKGASVQTSNHYLHDKTLKAYAWYSSIAGQNVQPEAEYANRSGQVEVWAPPRGYAVYSINGF